MCEIRVVSLCPSITKLIFDLGAGSYLAGITGYCVHPRDRVEAIEKLGGTKDPDTRRIIELAPDLVFMNKEENRREDWLVLESAGLDCRISFPVTVTQTMAVILQIGEALDRRKEARTIVEGIERAREKVRPRRSLHTSVSWAYLIWRKPWMAVSRNTYIHELITEAGGINVFAEMGSPYPAVSNARIAEAAPKRIFLSSEPFPFKEKHIRELSAATGLPGSRFEIVDGELLSWHGAFTEKALLYVERLLSREK